MNSDSRNRKTLSSIKVTPDKLMTLIKRMHTTKKAFARQSNISQNTLYKYLKHLKVSESTLFKINNSFCRLSNSVRDASKPTYKIIKDFLRDQGITQKEFASMCGFSERTIRRYLNPVKDKRGFLHPRVSDATAKRIVSTYVRFVSDTVPS